MAPRKLTSPVTAASPASAADFFTRGKKPTTTDRVIAVKKTTATTLYKHIPASNNNKFKTQKQQEGQDQNKLQDSTSRTVIVISDSEDDDKADNISRDEAGDDGDDAAWGFGDDLGPLDDFLSDDALGPQQSQSKPLRHIKLKEAVAEPLIAPVMPRVWSDKRPHSCLQSTPSVDIRHGIHQEDISEQEKTLRQFDLASKYGPCLDITRLERWERASLLGLSPPMDIKDLLVKNMTLNTPIFAGQV
ncbi:hypothetical protein BG015_007624 [Linnemannia schmuckeri]|uniref:DNA polymerase delta subunit 4 n=1 Tax=Linnemannia schmuckeri TaxID=64567 RepID=A0A9P5S0T4_9FUNG|nr:hypothetical protein BG015_007624 [Linnemannia schmuckeri]